MPTSEQLKRYFRQTNCVDNFEHQTNAWLLQRYPSRRQAGEDAKIIVHNDQTLQLLTTQGSALGLDMNAIDKNGHTPLMWACIFNKADAVFSLLTIGGSAGTGVKIKEGNKRPRLAREPTVWSCAQCSYQTTSTNLRTRVCEMCGHPRFTKITKINSKQKPTTQERKTNDHDHDDDDDDDDDTGVTGAHTSLHLNINFQTVQGDTALALALRDSDAQPTLIVLLEHGLKHGLDINMSDIDGMTAFMDACTYKDASAVSILLTYGTRYGLKINAKELQGETALSTCVLAAQGHGTVHCLRAVLTHGQDYALDINSRNMDDQTPLLLACLGRNAAAVSVLLAYGRRYALDINAQDRFEFSALTVCIIKKNLQNAVHCDNMFKCYTQLLDAGQDYALDVNTSSVDGWSVLTMALSIEHLQFTAYLLDKGKALALNVNVLTQEFSVLELAARTSIDHLKLLLEQGKQYKLDVNLSNTAGGTALMYFSHVNTPALKVLLDAEYAVHVNMITADGASAINLAARFNTDSLRLLLDKGHTCEPKLDVNLASVNGWSAIALATRFNTASLRLLLDKGHACEPKLDVNVQNHQGITALMLSASNTTTKSLKLLLASARHCNLNLNCQDLDRRTALIWACQSYRTIRNATVLLSLTEQYGLDVDVNRVDRFGQSGFVRLWTSGLNTTVIKKVCDDALYALLRHPGLLVPHGLQLREDNNKLNRRYMKVLMHNERAGRSPAPVDTITLYRYGTARADVHQQQRLLDARDTYRRSLLPYALQPFREAGTSGSDAIVTNIIGDYLHDEDDDAMVVGLD
jgi:ankyrin repeat protein